jgi:hypothetical protein
MISPLVYRTTGFVLACVLVLGSGCFYDKEETLYPEKSANTPVTFSGDIQPLISQNCALSGCHATGGQSPSLTSYQLIASNRDKIMARAVNGAPSPMPASGLMSKSNRDKLATWISQGALNN